jgi:GTP-sensing pleiotropic transcriptional regulator CodY
MDLTQRNSLEYNINKYNGLSFMQRNSIRYEFINIFKENIFLKILSFEKILPKHDNTIISDKISLINNNRRIIGYDLHYTYKNDKYSKIQKKTLFIPLYVYPHEIIKLMIFYYYLDKKNKKQEENEENIEIYFQDYNNYDYQFI